MPKRTPKPKPTAPPPAVDWRAAALEAGRLAFEAAVAPEPEPTPEPAWLWKTPLTRKDSR
jgi:hypothetical protein